MTPVDFRSLCSKLFGKRGWQIGCARFLKRPDGSHVNVRTVRRWSSGKTSVPVAVEMLLRAELEWRSLKSSLPEPVAVILNNEAKEKDIV